MVTFSVFFFYIYFVRCFLWPLCNKRALTLAFHFYSARPSHGKIICHIDSVKILGRRKVYDVADFKWNLSGRMFASSVKYILQKDMILFLSERFVWRLSGVKGLSYL